MKTPSILKSLTLLALALALAAPAAFAQSTLYWSGGTTNITDGTAVVTNWANMNGTWGTGIKNFATDTNGTTYSAWSNGAQLRVFSSGYLNDSTGQDITNTMITDMTAAGITWQFNAPTNTAAYNNKRLYINSSNVQTLTLATTNGTSPVIDTRAVGLSVAQSDTVGLNINQNVSASARVLLAGSNGFTKTGNLYLRLQNTNDGLTGTVNVLHNATSIDQGAAGSLEIGAGGATTSGATLAGVTRFNISAVGLGTGSATSAGARSRLRVLTGTNNANQLNDSAVISLAGLGQFEYQGRSNYSETISQLRLASSGVLNLATNANGFPIKGALVFTSGIDRTTNSLSPSSRAQLLVVANGVTGETTSTINLGSSHGLGSSVLPWATDSRARFFKVDGSNFLVTNTTTDVTDVSTIASSTTDYRITGTLSATNFASGAQANTLGIYRGAASAYTLLIADTLTIASGGLAVANDGGNTASIITGGSITTAANAPLYISTGASSTRGALVISSSITGNIDVAITGNSGVSFNGGSHNTYTGTTYINGGGLTLAKTGGINAVGSNIVVRSGGILVGNQNNNIPDGATVTVENGGFWNRSATTEVIASLVGGGMLTANTNSTGVTTITNSVTVGDSGIGTLIVSSAIAAGANPFGMTNGAVFNFELSGSGGTSDQMQFWNFSTGEFLLNNNNINLTLSGTQVVGTYTVSLFKFYSDAGTTLASSGISSGLTTNGVIGAGITNISLNYNSGGSSIDLSYEVVPEPSTLAMLGLAGLAAIGYRIRRNRRS